MVLSFSDFEFSSNCVPRLKHSSAELFVTDPKENYVFDFYRNPKPPGSFRKLTPISKIFFEKDSFKPM